MGWLVPGRIAVIFCASAFVANIGFCEDAAVTNTAKVLKVVPGEKVSLACKTSAIGMDFDPFKTTEGTLQLSIDFADGKDPNVGEIAASTDIVGSWNGSVGDTAHEASLGLLVAGVCETGCVVRLTSAGNFELWAPAPVMPSKLEKDQSLTLATLDSETLELKATTFRNKQLSILEKGPCEVVKP